MHISNISTINFCGAKSSLIKNAVKKAEEVKVDYNSSAYSVPTGEFPMEHMSIKRHPFSPDDNIVANEYLKAAEKRTESKPSVIDFVSESSIF